MSGIYAFPFGQADCFLAELEEGGQTTYILIDGGSRLWPGAPLSYYLEERGVDQLDLMIQTHLHQDHLGWLADGAQGTRVRRAVLPARSAKLWPVLETFENREPAADCREQARLERILREQWADVRYACEMEDFASLPAGGWTMTLIWPSRHVFLPFSSAVMERQMGRGTAGREERWEERLISQINGDSSVWLLHRDGRQLALFCGDCFEELFLDRYELFVRQAGLAPGVEILKLSHHGRNDKGHLYFTDRILEAAVPEKVLLTNTAENAARYESQREFFGDRAVVAGEEEIFLKFIV